MAILINQLVTTDGNYPSADGVSWVGYDLGEGTALANGTFDGATVTYEFKNPVSSTWAALGTDTTLTSSGGGAFRLQGSATSPVRVRVTVSGAGAGTSIGLAMYDQGKSGC
jgi:hypothetical protein